MNQEQLFQITTIDSHLVVIMVAQKKGLLTSCVKAMKDLKHRSMKFTKTRKYKDIEDSYDYGPEIFNRFRSWELYAFLKSRELKTTGSKSTRIARLVADNIAYMEKRVIEQLMADESDDEDETVAPPPPDAPTAEETTVAPEKTREVRKFNYAGNVYLVDTANAVYCQQTHVHIGTLNMESKKIEYMDEILFTPSDEQEEIKVIRFRYKNSVYWKNESTGNIYSKNNGHRIGTYNDSTNKITFLNSFN